MQYKEEDEVRACMFRRGKQNMHVVIKISAVRYANVEVFRNSDERRRPVECSELLQEVGAAFHFSFRWLNGFLQLRSVCAGESVASEGGRRKIEEENPLGRFKCYWAEEDVDVGDKVELKWDVQ